MCKTMRISRIASILLAVMICVSGINHIAASAETEKYSPVDQYTFEEFLAMDNEEAKAICNEEGVAFYESVGYDYADYTPFSLFLTYSNDKYFIQEGEYVGECNKELLIEDLRIPEEYYAATKTCMVADDRLYGYDHDGGVVIFIDTTAAEEYDPGYVLARIYTYLYLNPIIISAHIDRLGGAINPMYTTTTTTTAATTVTTTTTVTSNTEPEATTTEKEAETTAAVTTAAPETEEPTTVPETEAKTESAETSTTTVSATQSVQTASAEKTDSPKTGSGSIAGVILAGVSALGIAFALRKREE